MKKDQILKDLEKFIAIDSVAADLDRRPSMRRAMEFLTKKLTSLGFKIETLAKGEDPPLIIATYFINDKAKTIGIYGHYDVQPEDPINEWKSSPFSLFLRDGKFFGRGAADNKGHIIQNISAVEELINSKQLSNNITFIIEGEEEVGSFNLENYLQEAKNILSSIDVFYVTDVGMHDKNRPQIFYALRGILYFELEVSIGERDLHSGIYGNRVYNPINILADLIAKIKDVRTGRILIPGFNEAVRKIDEEELQLLSAIARSDEEEKKEANTFAVISLNKEHPYLSSKIYPSFDVNGIIGGYTGEGAKTVIPKTARTKFSFRLVEHQDAHKMVKLIEKFIKDNLPEGVSHTLKIDSVDAPFYTDINNEYIKKTADILEDVFKNKTVFNRAGGSVSAAELFQRFFKKPIILTGFTTPGDNIHAPNENFDEEMFWKGIEALKNIYSKI